MKIQGNKYVNHSFFRPFLFLYDDLIVYRKRRKVFYVDEVSVSYNHIVQVNIHTGLWFAKLEIITPGSDDVTIKGVWKKPATRAKTIMDQKIYQAHSKKFGLVDENINHQISDVEKNIQRLKELHAKGKISKKEYEKKKKQLLKKIK
jgi:hypothetical protein